MFASTLCLLPLCGKDESCFTEFDSLLETLRSRLGDLDMFRSGPQIGLVDGVRLENPSF